MQQPPRLPIDHLTPIPYTPNRLAIHMALATSRAQISQPKLPWQRKLWSIYLQIMLVAVACAVTAVVVWQILRIGL